MKIVVGNKTKELSKAEFEEKISNFEKVILDIGTGDGKFVYQSALENPKNFYIGLDPVKSQMVDFSKKTNKKRLDNAIFVIGSIEILPFETTNFANEIKILFPWGTLLEKVVKPDISFTNSLKGILKPNSSVEMVFGYSKDLEPGEAKRLNLPEIDINYIKNQILPFYSKNGLNTKDIRESSNNPQKFTSWMKKLRKNRTFFAIQLVN